MIVNDTLANTTRAAHDVGLAAWLGGVMFGEFAHNPSLARITSHTERGGVSSAAWNGYNLINTAGLGAAALGWTAARFTETRPANLTSTEQALSYAKDGLMAAAVLFGLASGVQGSRLAHQAPNGAVAIETGTKPATETPAKAARIQRSLGVLGNVNILTGAALVAVNAIIAQTNHSHPAAKRTSTTRSIPLWLGAAATTTAAVVDTTRRARR